VAQLARDLGVGEGEREVRALAVERLQLRHWSLANLPPCAFLC
jgi:hypothetical protein